MNKVLVIGDVILDQYIDTSTKKISDEAPVIVSRVGSKILTLGGAGNVARNIAALGGDVTLLSICDPIYESIIMPLLKKWNIKNKLFFQSNSTCIKTRVTSRHQQVFRFDEEYDAIVCEKIEKESIGSLNALIESHDIIVVSKYFDTFLTKNLIIQIMNKTKKIGKPIIVDSRQADYELFRGATIIKPNLRELSILAKDEIKNKTSEIISTTKFLAKKLDIKYFITTRSEAGFTITGDIEYNQSSKAIDVFDVSGAGDTFVATIATFWNLRPNGIKNSANIANEACAVAVKKFGTQVVFNYELPHIDNNLEILKAEVRVLRNNDKKIAFTNGVFDILHDGHIFSLKEASKYGDYLIVGLNSDKSVKRLKGDNRPIKSQKIRKLILESFSFVDRVVIFDDDPSKILKIINPDFYIKGKDYTISNLPGHEFAKKIILVDLIKDSSTTNFIKKIQSRNE